MPVTTTIFFFIWAAALFVAIWAVRVVQAFGNRMPRVALRKLDPITSSVVVILPVKGVEADTETNIKALFLQDYHKYRLIFAVQSQDDPAVELIGQIAASCQNHNPKTPVPSVDIVIAGTATDRGQKIHNQLAAVARTNDDDDILIFMDADAHPAPNWVHALTLPLTYGDHIGATTGYRYYVPAPDSPTSKFRVNCWASVINAGITALFGPYRRAFAWGGSMAIRRRDFFAYGVADGWQTALSDDYVLSNVVKKNKAKIHFVPQCIVISHAKFQWHSFWEFAVRQYRITRICAPLIWLAALTGPILFLFSLIYTGLFAIIHGISPPPQRPYESWLLAIMFISLYGLYLLRGYLMVRGMKRLLPTVAPEIHATRFWFTWGYPLVQAINLLTLLGSAFGKQIVWRGIRYILHSRTQTTVIHPAQPKPDNSTTTPEISSQR